MTQNVILAYVDNNNAIYLTNDGFTQGETLTYASLEQDGTNTIGGLTDTNNYLANVIDPNTFQLLDPTSNQVVPISDPGVAGTQSFSWISNIYTFDPTVAVTGETAEINLPGNTLQNGDIVIYNTDLTKSKTVALPTQAADGTISSLTETMNDPAIGGLDNFGEYYVVKVDANDIRLVSDAATSPARSRSR